MDKLAVVITTAPYSNLTISAIDYVETALKLGIDVIGIFFYQDGVINANADVSIASDEYQTIEHLTKLHRQYKLPLHLCITAAEKRGIVCEESLNKESAEQYKINDIFTISGLGELVELSASSTRLVQF